jgi:hypothetical protein
VFECGLYDAELPLGDLVLADNLAVISTEPRIFTLSLLDLVESGLNLPPEIILLTFFLLNRSFHFLKLVLAVSDLLLLRG